MSMFDDDGAARQPRASGSKQSSKLAKRKAARLNSATCASTSGTAKPGSTTTPGVAATPGGLRTPLGGSTVRKRDRGEIEEIIFSGGRDTAAAAAAARNGTRQQAPPHIDVKAERRAFMSHKVGGCPPEMQR